MALVKTKNQQINKQAKLFAAILPDSNANPSVAVITSCDIIPSGQWSEYQLTLSTFDKNGDWAKQYENSFKTWVVSALKDYIDFHNKEIRDDGELFKPHQDTDNWIGLEVLIFRTPAKRYKKDTAEVIDTYPDKCTLIPIKYNDSVAMLADYEEEDKEDTEVEVATKWLKSKGIPRPKGDQDTIKLFKSMQSLSF